MAMGLLHNTSASGPGTAGGKGLAAKVGALWREHLKITRDELNMSMFRGHGLFDDDVGIYQGVGKPINTAPLDSLFGFAVSIGIRPVVEISYCPRALAGICSDKTDAYNGFTCAPNLNATYADAVPLPAELRNLPAPHSDYARGNVAYAQMVKEAVSYLVHKFGIEEVRQWRFEGWNEPNGMAAWCDGQKDDCRTRNLWGNHNLTTQDSEPISHYPACKSSTLLQLRCSCCCNCGGVITVGAAGYLIRRVHGSC